KGKIFYKEEEVMDVKDVKLIGAHNIENVLPAVVMAKELGASNEDIVHVIKTFPGLAHRLELVREVRGVRYFNDSFATTPETSMAAVDSFEVPTILIAGGSEKGLDYNEWAVKILTKPSLRIVILIGATAEKMEKALMGGEEKLGAAMGSPTKVLRRKDLDEALIDAYAEAEEGWVVVMSPAAASFGLFKNYKERGATFKDLVAKLR
ncbi:MAG: cyanophycin synthetase, partial [Candidatus Gracilibacteria bacterium]